MTTSADSIALHPDIMFRTVDDEGVVVDQRQPEVMVVNRQAIHILELIRSTGSRKAVMVELEKKYDADQETISSDLDTFLNELRERKILV